jgi:hypothetical protein
MTLDLTRRDTATLVAALHAWQNELSYHTVEELAEWHPQLRDHEPLTIAEVDGLLWRLAAGAAGSSQQEDGAVTVSSVSTVSKGTGGVL